MKPSVEERLSHRGTRFHKPSLSRFPFTSLNRVKNVLILCHRHADVDAYCSAYALARLFRILKKEIKVVVAAPQGFSLLVNKIRNRFKIDVVEDVDLRQIDLIVAVDTGSPELLEEWLQPIASTKILKLLIDHHPYDLNAERIFDKIVVYENASSTCEVVHKLYTSLGVKVSPAIAQALLTGILFDSQHLTIASCRTIHTVDKLCEAGASLLQSRRTLSLRREAPEAIARLKGARRMKVYRFGRWLAVCTNIGSYHASVARAMIELGADLALAEGEHEGQIRASLRSTQTFYDETRVHLGSDVAKPVAELLKGSGGGHPTAASLSCGNLDADIAEAVLKLLSDRLQTQYSEIN